MLLIFRTVFETKSKLCTGLSENMIKGELCRNLPRYKCNGNSGIEMISFWIGFKIKGFIVMLFESHFEMR